MQKFKNNKIKKVFLGAVILKAISSTQNVAAQESGAYAKLIVGYGFATGTLSGSNVTLTTSTRTQEAVNLSLGKVINFGGAFRFSFNKNVAAELGVGYLLGGETNFTNRQANGDVDEDVFSAKMLQIKPTLIISAGMDKLNPYAKLGVLLASGTVTEEINGSFTGGTGIRIEEFKGGLQFGIQGGLGAEYKLSEKLALFGELNFNSLSFSPTESEKTVDNTTAGVTVTNNLTGANVISIKTEYEDSVTFSSAPDVNAPSKAVKESIPASSFGVNFGVKYKF